MDIDLPEVVAEMRKAFNSYEKALVTNDVAALTEMFRDDPRTIRYGAGEILYGSAEIKAFRVARSPVALGAHDLAHRHYHVRPRIRGGFDALRAAHQRPARLAGRCRPG